MAKSHHMACARLLIASTAILTVGIGAAQAQSVPEQAPSAAAAAVPAAPAAAAPAAAGPSLEEMRALRRQLEEMRQQLKAQSQQIEQLQERSRQATEDAAQAKAAADTAQSTADDARKGTSELASKPLITSGSPKVKLAISGQIDRLLNFANDGKSTKGYFVDNNVSPSRVRFVGTGQVTEDISIGTNIELGISPNNSNQVSQTNEDSGDTFDERKVEAIFKSLTYGAVSFGKGDPATKDIARIDLSGTDVLAYAATGDIAGGLFFREDDGDDLTAVQVKQVFTDFDSSRQNRIRYDTPTIAGFTAAASASSDQRWGAALRWAGQGYGLKVAAGIGVQDPNQDGVRNVYAGSVSALHEATGLNLTYGTAFKDQSSSGTGQLQYIKAGWQHEFLPIGKTAFSIDFGLDKDAPANGDEGKTVGLVALQNISAYGTELFAGFRLYDLDQGNGPNTSTIYVGTVGTRVKF